MKTSTWSYTPFEGLREALNKSVSTESRHPGLPSKHPHKGTKITTVKTDEELFLEAMADVREIKEFRGMPFRAGELRTRPSKKDDALRVLREIVEGKHKIRLSDTGEYMEWVSPEVNRGVAQRLHEGRFAVQDSIDLHGMTLEEAEAAFFSFFREGLKERRLCLKVIHGRGLKSSGDPVLKKAVRGWLEGKLRKWVYAFTTARDCDGGLGATYILLKMKK